MNQISHSSPTASSSQTHSTKRTLGAAQAPASGEFAELFSKTTGRNEREAEERSDLFDESPDATRSDELAAPRPFASDEARSSTVADEPSDASPAPDSSVTPGSPGERVPGEPSGDQATDDSDQNGESLDAAERSAEALLAVAPPAPATESPVEPLGTTGESPRKLEADSENATANPRPSNLPSILEQPVDETGRLASSGETAADGDDHSSAVPGLAVQTAAEPTDSSRQYDTSSSPRIGTAAPQSAENASLPAAAELGRGLSTPLPDALTAPPTPDAIDPSRLDQTDPDRSSSSDQGPSSDLAEMPDGMTRNSVELHAARSTPRSTGLVSTSSDPATGQAPVSLTAQQSARLLDRVRRAFDAARRRARPLRIRLHPPELGSLRLELQVRRGAVRAQMETDTAAARTALIEHLAQLKERLAEAGLRVESFDIQWRGSSAGDRSFAEQQFSDQRETWRSSANRPAAPESPSAQLPRSADDENTMLTDYSKLNVRV